jgi:sugar/nucleoside kinase (ribokinase family)
MPLDVAVIGPVNVDLILSGAAPHQIEEIRNWFGLSDVTLNAAGSAGYPAQVFQKLGLQTGLLTVTADDALGSALRYEMAKLGIDLSRVRVVPGEISQIAIYMLLFGSKKRPLTGRRSSHQPWPAPLDKADLDYLTSVRLIHIAGYLHYPSMWDDDIPNMLRDAKRRGQMTSLDPQFPLWPLEGRWLPGIGRLLPYVDALLVDQDEARNITGLESLDEAGRLLRQAGPQIVVVKRGEQGALVYYADQCIEQPAQRVPEDEIADTIGAGDAFDGGFLAALLRGRSVAEAARIGAAVAAISVRGHGAATALRAEDTIDRLIERYS